MICRLWRGWTTPENADAYERVVRGEVIPGIEARKIPGFRHIDLMRRDLGDEVEFQTLMWFDSLDSIMAFMGEDYAVSHVPPQAQAVLKRFDERAAHFEVIDRREQRWLSRAADDRRYPPVADRFPQSSRRADRGRADGFVLLSGPNGAGKTNVLEAVSLLTPGRGLRQVPIAEMARSDGPGGFAVAARLDDDTEIGTGTTRGRARPPAGADQRRAGRGQLAWRTAGGAVADAGDGPAVHRERGRPAALPRPADPGAGAGPCPPRRALRGGDAVAQQAARRRAARPTLTGWRRLEAQMAEHGAALGEARVAAPSAR